VITPSLTFCAGAASIALLGATPVFCEVRGADDLCLDPADVRACLNERTKAIVVTHFAGWGADIAAIAGLAAAHGVAVIEDAAHAPVVEAPGGRLGTHGDVGCFSCYATKNVPMGEGGVLVARDPRVLERLRLLRAHGLQRPDVVSPDALDYDVVALSLNFRPTELGAAVGLRQLSRLRDERARRAELVARYRRRLDAVAGVELPFREREEDAAHHILPVLLPPAADRVHVRRRLADRGVQTSVHYPPTHLLSAFRRFSGGPDALPLTEELAARELTLPLHAQLSDDSVERVMDVLEAALPLETIA
jgi:dTDP-4-amino-4,6-dideoxygalactose transaminase